MTSPSPGQTPEPATAHALPAIAILGLGEVGRIYGGALTAAGHRVSAYDPFNTKPVEGVTIVESLERAVGNADMVFTLTAAAASRTAAQQARGALRPHAIYADFTSSAPDAKRALQDLFADRQDIRLVDVAILGPVVQLGMTTPLMAAGPAAEDVAKILRTLGAEVEVVDGGLGDAVGQKLLRSVFMKSLAAAVTEAVRAGSASGHEDWIRNQIARELAGDGQQTINRFLRGSVLHAARRSQEMDAATEYLRQLGVNPIMSQAAATLHRELQNSQPSEATATP